MEGIVVLLGLGLLVGLLVRKKGDNTMETLSKGCGCLFLIAFLLILFYTWQYSQTA